MVGQSVTLNLPALLYERLAERASQAHRSVEDELCDLCIRFDAYDTKL